MSMGNAAGLKAWQVLANAERALAIELLAGAQAVEFLAPLEPGAGRARGARRSCGRSRRGSRDDRPLAARHRARGRRRSATASLVAAVEAEIGELAMSVDRRARRRGRGARAATSRAIRAPRGTDAERALVATEAPLRMLLNNLDAEVAERPEELVVYGGSGQGAARSTTRSSDRPDAAPAGRRRDAARPERKAGRRLPHARGRAARADRELAARAALGDVGRVPAARGRGLTMFGQMTAG